MFGYILMEKRVPENHRFRGIRHWVDEILRDMSKRFDELDAKQFA
jgi:hypothetical protein